MPELSATMQLPTSWRHSPISARASLAAYCTHNARREQNPIESCILGEFGLLAVKQGAKNWSSLNEPRSDV